MQRWHVLAGLWLQQLTACCFSFPFFPLLFSFFCAVGRQWLVARLYLL
jgi:hypothetical protein